MSDTERSIPARVAGSFGTVATAFNTSLNGLLEELAMTDAGE